ncbi:hypothetical protein ACVIGA_005928 [Bradyrhizobium sp. USDA 3240]
MAAETGFFHTTIRRMWAAFGLPHRSQTFKLSSDPLFVVKVGNIIGLYLSQTEPLSSASMRKATFRHSITSMDGLRASKRASQRFAVEPLRIAQRTAALAPMINSRRRVRSPMRDVSPSFCFPPVERCSGVSPSQAAKSRPLLFARVVGARANERPSL